VTRTREYLSRVQGKIKRYAKGNWGYPFIAAFMLLLFVAAVFLAVPGFASLAEIIADVAYFALAAGVVLQLAYLSRNKGKNQGVVLDGPS
jgi:hypothetical protein